MNDYFISESDRLAGRERIIQSLFAITQSALSKRIGRKQTISPRMPVCWVARVSGVIEHNNGNVFVLNSSIQLAPFAACSPHIITLFSFAAPVMPGDTFII